MKTYANRMQIRLTRIENDDCLEGDNLLFIELELSNRFDEFIEHTRNQIVGDVAESERLFSTLLPKIEAITHFVSRRY